MPLAPGTRIGPYEIVSAIGAGGMGEVYCARDTKLNREVALKVLPSLFTDDPDRLARFDREARLLAALNHPNIAHVYGLEEGDGDLRAIAMELVSGETLAERINGAALPLDAALPIARQIAAAFETAHDAGIVHRDLKPANVKVRDDGTVKVLDFGLAKALESPTESSAGAMNSPTLTARATQLGMVLGTAAYMSPEQAKGKSVDRRADVWAFGAVFYEMLTGRRAFEGDDVSEVMASVLKLDPDWSALPADLPEPLRRLLRRCLEKDPKRRLRDIGEGMVQLDEGLSVASATVAARSAIDLPSLATGAAAAAARPLWRRAAPLAAGALAIVAATALATYALIGTAPQPATGLVRFLHVPDASARLAISQNYSDVALSPDGRALVYPVATVQQPALNVRRFDALQAVALRGAEAAYHPFVSPDSQWVGFIDVLDFTRIKKVSILGGPPVVITKAKATITGASWTGDGTIVFGALDNGLSEVSDGGGAEATPGTTLDKTQGETSHALPYAVPDSPVVLFVTVKSSPYIDNAQLAAWNRKSGRVVRLKIAGTRPRYVRSGHLVYAAADASLRAVRFDLDRLEVQGNPVPMMEGVGVKASGGANYDVTPAGQLAFVGGSTIRVERSVVWVDRTGRETPTKAQPRTYYYARVSPDGSRLALDVRDEQQDVWIWEERGTLTRLTAGHGSDEYGLWTPDSRRVISYSTVNQKPGLYSSRADITGAPELIVERQGSYPNAVTPDGKSLVFRSTAGGTKGKNDLFVVSLTGDKTVKTLLGTEHDELNAAISPDGRWIAYQSDLSSRTEIYVSPYPNVGGGQWTISTAGGSEPAWAPSGRELYYLAPDSKFMAVAVSTTPQFVPRAPVPLFETTAYFFGGIGRNYDVGRDGRQFVMIKDPVSAAGGSQPITVVLNWVDELKARLPRR
jgi:hypothetical protein